MDYFVIGQDGAEYGPATVEMLRQWAEQNRLQPQSMIRSTQTNETVPASSVAGIFPAPEPSVPPVAEAVPQVDWSRPPNPSPYPRQTPTGASSGTFADLIGVSLRCVMALACFFFLHTVGLFIAGYALIYAIQLKARNHHHGNASLVIAAVTFVIILIGWAFRLTGTRV